MSPSDAAYLRSLPVADAIRFWDAAEKYGKSKGERHHRAAIRELILADLYYLLVRVCGRVDMLPCMGREGFVDNQFAFERCREVQANPDGYLDLWAREHWKSSIITFGLTLHDILNDPETTFGFFSHTRPIAKAFLRQIQREMESNKVLHACFPDILWGENTKESPKWSEDDGIIVRRKSNPNEATIEAWGLVDGQPTSKHFRKLLYDDVVVAGSVTNEEMIAKVMVEMERSYNLGTTPGVKRAVGTRWSFNDAYRTMMDRGTLIAREYPGRKGGQEDGETIVWNEETHHKKRRDYGPYTYAAQILMNPKADALQGFKRDWFNTYKTITKSQSDKMTKYLLVDAASSKKKSSDYTAMMVVGLGSDGNYYILDMIRDRLSLTERADRVFKLHRDWKPKEVRYEKYGLMADVDHIKTRQESENYRFPIVEVAGQTKKQDRIGRLIPLFEQGKVYFPASMHITNYEKVTVDLVKSFLEEEYAAFPVGIHDDMLDALSRVCEPDLKLVWPKEEKKVEEPQRQFRGPQSETAWMR